MIICTFININTSSHSICSRFFPSGLAHFDPVYSISMMYLVFVSDIILEIVVFWVEREEKRWQKLCTKKF